MYETKGNVAIITLNRPDRLNALTGQTMQEIGQALGQVANDDSVRVAIITGAGRAFCAGGDRKSAAKMFAERGPRPKLQGYLGRSFEEAAKQFLALDKPVIAAVNGHAIGGGMDIALWCDLRIASEKAIFAEMYIARGLIPDLGGIFLLPRLIGHARACEVLLTGDKFDAQTAKEMGIVNRVVPHEKLMDEAMALAKSICKNPPLGVKMTKRLLNMNRRNQWPLENDYHYAIHGYLIDTEDFLESDRAFIAKREPKFKGR